MRARLGLRPLRWLVFWFVLSTCRWGIKTRENLRLARSRSFGVLKRIYRALARRFVALGYLKAPDDLDYLTLDELAAHVRGVSVTRDLDRLVALRKQEYDASRARAVSPRVVAHGAVYENRFERPLACQTTSACCAGSMQSGSRDGAGQGAARAFGERPRRGRDLVASATDPGWVFLMIAAGGLVSEREAS